MHLNTSTLYRYIKADIFLSCEISFNKCSYVKITLNYLIKQMDKRERCNTYLRKAWRLLWSIKRLEKRKKERQYLSFSSLWMLHNSFRTFSGTCSSFSPIYPYIFYFTFPGFSFIITIELSKWFSIITYTKLFVGLVKSHSAG